MPLDRDFLTRHFGDLWPIHNRAFAALMIECRRRFDGDMDQMLILSVIGERTLTTERASGLTYAEFLDGTRSPGDGRCINIQSIADSTGIPRETVRRKVNRLADRGWLRRTADGTFEITREAAVDLTPATQATFDYLLAVGNALLAAAGRR